MKLQPWSGPKAAVLRYPNELIYGLSADGTAVYLGEIACEVPHMPPYDRELAIRQDGNMILVLGSSALRGQRFLIVEKRKQGDGDPSGLNDAA